MMYLFARSTPAKDVHINKMWCTMINNDCQHLIAYEYPEKYDGIWEWKCLLLEKTQPRFIDNLRYKGTDKDAIDKLCNGCRHYLPRGDNDDKQ